MIDIVLDRLAPRLPRGSTTTAGLPLVASAILHVAALIVVAAFSIQQRLQPTGDIGAPTQTAPVAADQLPRIVFRMPQARGNGGGGGGGNRDPAPIRHAEGRGNDRATLPTRPTAPAIGMSFTEEDRPPAVLLDARPLASGSEVHAGLPIGGVPFGNSQGPGSGGGVGTGIGTGIGSGAGPGIGRGSGGGTGGGVYRPGGSVTAPRLLMEVKPTYTADSLLRKIQGPVWLEVVVDRSGVPAAIHVKQSLDPGLDEAAVAAMRQWRFAPGTLAGSPVDVQVVVLMEFTIH